jgi:hypothetical protein
MQDVVSSAQRKLFLNSTRRRIKGIKVEFSKKTQTGGSSMLVKRILNLSSTYLQLILNLSYRIEVDKWKIS